MIYIDDIFRYSMEELDTFKINPGLYDLSKSPWPEDSAWQWRAVDEDGYATYFKAKPHIEYTDLIAKLDGSTYRIGLWCTEDEDSASEEFPVEEIEGYPGYTEYKTDHLMGSWQAKNWKGSLEERP